MALKLMVGAIGQGENETQARVGRGNVIDLIIRLESHERALLPDVIRAVGGGHLKRNVQGRIHAAPIG